jgi:hypothetical protein
LRPSNTAKVKVDRYGYPIVDVEEPKPKPTRDPGMVAPKTQEELLWTEYAVKPNLPIKTKIEQLIILWRMPVPVIASLLNISEKVVEEEVVKLNKEWAALGKPLAEEARDIVRGRMIAELLKLKGDIDAFGSQADSRLLTTKLQIIEKLIKLQGIEIDKKDTELDESPTNLIEDALKKLSPNKLEALYARLREEKT